MTQEYLDLQQDTNYTRLPRRSQMETFCDILSVVGKGAEKPTHIMHKANLSWNVMQVYIKSLEAQGLLIVSSEHGRHQYHLSDKGFVLLNQILPIIGSLKLQDES